MSCSQPIIQSFQFQGYDPELLQEVINGAQLEHDILGATACSAHVNQWRSEQLSIDSGFYSFPVFVRGQFADGQLCIGFSKGEVEPTWVNGVHLDRNSLQVYAEGAEMTYRAGPSTVWFGITISREWLQVAALEHLGFELDLPSVGMRNYSSPSSCLDPLISQIKQANQSASRIEQAPHWQRNQILKLVIEALAAGDPTTARTIEARRQQQTNIVRRADATFRAFIKDGSKYSSPELCRALGLSERALQMQFKECLGMSPKAWFRHLALNQARSTLLRKKQRPGIVSEIAMDYGFEHLGRFSRDYRKLFGESPSETASQIPLRIR